MSPSLESLSFRSLTVLFTFASLVGCSESMTEDTGSEVTEQQQAFSIGPISSLRVSPGYAVTVYDFDAMYGGSASFSTDQPTLGLWDDTISSIEVYQTRFTPVATLYEHSDYYGYSVDLRNGSYSLYALQLLGMKNDDISSLKPFAPAEVLLHENDGFSGNLLQLDRNTPSSSSWGWDNRVSSVPVRQNRWTYCAQEDYRCNFSGTMPVRYGDGASARYYTGVRSNGTDCNNSNFGDPAQNVRKECYHTSPALCAPRWRGTFASWGGGKRISMS